MSEVAGRISTDRPCIADGCPTPVIARGRCSKHYKQFQISDEFERVILPWPQNLLTRLVRQKSGCLWIDLAPDGNGYSCIHGSEGKKTPGHIAHYEYVLGPVPDGLQLDHLCHNADPSCPGNSSCLHRRCVEVTHLEPTTPRVNTLRGQSLTAVNARKTHCIHGHEFTEENTYWYATKANGRLHRMCRACCRDRDIARKARLRAERLS